MTAESDIEHLRRLIGDDCRTEDVMPLCAGLIAATPIQAKAIQRYRAALEQIAAWPLSPGPDLLYIARKALES